MNTVRQLLLSCAVLMGAAPLAAAAQEAAPAAAEMAPRLDPTAPNPAPVHPELAGVFEDFGGMPGLTALMDDFMTNLVADPRTREVYLGS